MQITVASTTKIVELNGVPARVWEGETELGIKIHCFITRIAVDEKDDQEQFEKELKSHRPPSPAVQAYDPRMLL